MKRLVYVGLLFCSLLGFGQSKGDSFRNEGNIHKAIKAYKADFITDNKNAKNTYNLACAYALTQQKDSAFYYLRIALKNDSSLWALADNDLLAMSADNRWKEIEENQLNKFEIKNGSLKNRAYAKELLRLIKKDQALDYQLDMAKRFYMKNGQIPHWYYPIATMKEEIGKDNFSTIQKLIQQHGWPTYSMVGKLAADAPLLIINHLESEEMRIKYLPHIKKACMQKEGSCMEYAKIQDRILVNTGKPQRYGMQFRYNNKRQLEPFPIKEPMFVDQRRKEIGLPPLKDYLKRKINYDWTIEQKTK